MAVTTKPHPMAKHFPTYADFRLWRNMQEEAASKITDPIRAYDIREYLVDLEDALYGEPKPTDPHDKQKYRDCDLD